MTHISEGFEEVHYGDIIDCVLHYGPCNYECIRGQTGIKHLTLGLALGDLLDSEKLKIDKNDLYTVADDSSASYELKSESLSDEHYKGLPFEPFQVQEQINEYNVEIPLKARLAVAYGTKYPVRAGRKKGENWQKDIRKAINYYFRALTGKWISESDITEYFKNFKDE